MSPLAGFLIFIVSITALVIAYLTKQFQEENIIYSNNNQMKNKNLNIKTVAQEKIVIDLFYERFAMIGLIAAIRVYLTTDKKFPGFV